MFSGSGSSKNNTKVIGSDNNICRSSNNNNNNNKSVGGNLRMLLFPPLQVQQRQVLYPLLLLIIILSCQIEVVDGGLGIPGAAATKSGYDTEVGQDAMCWRSVADQGPAANLSVPNPLVANFKLLDAIQLLNECPTGNVLRADPPVEMALRNERLRTFQFYNYTVDITLNLTSLSSRRAQSPSLSRGISRRGLAGDDGREHDDDNDNYKFVSDWGPRVAIQIVVCSLGNSGFCSPYIHEEANARLFRLGLPLSPEPGYRHGGSHVHSPYKFVDLNPSEGPIFNISLQVPMLVNVPGAYFAVAAIQMMIARSEFAPVEIRYDMANAMHEYEQRIVHYQDPAIILEVPPNVKICSYIAIGIAGSVLLYLLVETVRNCTHQVIRLTQGSFLIMFLAVALTATVCSFLFEPKNDLYCQASYPILLICLQCMYAITLGRLWRINSMISPLLVRTMAGRKLQPTKSKSNLHQKSSLSLSICTARNCMELAGGKLMELTRSVAFFGSPDYRNMDARGRQNAARSSVTSSVRMKITDWHLARVVFFFTFPQVIMQIMSVTLQPHTRVIEFNADESVGRATCRCTREIPAYMSILYWSCFMFLLLLLMLLVMSAGTRKLPSLFSETQDIMDSAISSLVLLVLGVAIILVTTEPTVSPGVQYLVCVFMALSVCLNLSLRIMLPKLQMVWRGEVVLVSKLVSDHNRQIKEHDRQMYNPKKTAVYVTGVKMNNTSSGDFNHRSTVSSTTPIPGGMPLPSNSVEVEEAMESLSDEESSVNMANVFDDDDEEEELDNNDGCDDEGHVVEIEEEIDNHDDENDGNSNNQDDLTETEVGVNDDVESPTPATVSGELSSSSNGEQVVDGQQQQQQQIVVPEIVQQLLPPQSHHSAPGAAATSTSTASVSPLSIATTTENHLTSPSSSGAFVAAPTANSPRQVVPASSARQQLTRSQNNLSASVMSTIQQRQQTLRQRVQSEKGSHRLILISSDESPARRLILKMVDAQEQLAAVNERVMSGRTVSEHEWETTRKLANRLSDTFRREVLFTWETGYGSSSSGAMSSPYGSSATLTTRNNGVRRRKSSTSKRREQDVIQEGNEEDEDEDEEQQSGGC